MELLDIQIDLFHFKGLLDSIGTENQENTHEQLSGRLLYYISKYKNSPSVTMQQANLMLSHVERLFKLMIVYKPEEFMECLLNTNAGNELRKKGIGAVLERKFATLIPLDKLYLLYLEYYCRELVIQGNLSESVRSDTEKVLRTVDEIREAERIYAEQMPVDTLLLKVFDKMFEGKIKLETSERIDLLAGRGRLSLTVVPQSENNNKQLAQMKIACKPISEGVAHLSKIGVYDNLGRCQERTIHGRSKNTLCGQREVIPDRRHQTEYVDVSFLQGSDNLMAFCTLFHRITICAYG